MRIIKIAKGNGKFRTVYVPNPTEKARLSSLVSTIARKAARACPEGVCHGFTAGRSPVTNALVHAGHALTLKFDLTDFFESVTPEKVAGKLTREELALALMDGSARQGLPTSPAVANLAAAGLDHAILKLRDRRKIQFVYTRYADDLSFSHDDPAVTGLLRLEVPNIVKRCGFVINPDKTRLQTSRGGRRIITGVAVDEQGIHPTRTAKRRLRAALHQGHKEEARGLAEWCLLKPPRDRSRSATSKDTVEALVKAWRLPRLNPCWLPDKGADRDIGEGCILTGDPAYMLGMSTFTTGWGSCTVQPNGQYRRGVLFWTLLRGTRIGCLLSDRTKIVGGVERRVMRARCLVHELRNGVFVYDRLYGNPEDIARLRQQCTAAEFLPVARARQEHPGIRVVGHAPARFSPYLDSLKSSSAKASSGPWRGRLVRTVHL